MVSIFYDKDGLYSGYKDLVVAGFDEYVDAYVTILSAIKEQKDLVVVTSNKQIYAQFEAMKSFYPRAFMQKQFSIREDFKEKYGIEIPDYLSESELSEDKTYQEMDFTTGESFENVVLRRYFDGFFVKNKFPFQLLPEMCEKLSFGELKKKENIILRKVFQHRIKEYEAELVGDFEKFIYTEFIHNFDSLRNDVALYLAIKNYPKSFKDDVLGRDMTRCMDHFRLEGKKIEVDASIEESYKDRATVFLNSKDISFSDALSYVSGEFSFELELVLRKNASPNEREVDELLQKFEALFVRNPYEKEKVLLLKAPSEVCNPDGIDSIEEWMKWALDSYLPYRFWMELSGKTDTNVDEYAAKYGDWIFDNYDTLVNSHPLMMYKILPSLKDNFVSSEHSIMIILDNFNYKFVPELTEYLHSAGFNKLEEKPVLSMIPTETAISKRAFFTGEAYNNNQQGYDKLVQNWAEQIGISMKYLPNAGALRDLSDFSERVIFLNYLRIDEMLHENQSDSAQSIEVRIRQELRALVDLLVITLKRLGREKNTDIYFIADHGSTKISSEQVNAIDPKYYKDKAKESDYRFIAVNDEDFESTKNAIGALCYALDKNRYGTQYNYFIAKRYNRFIRNEMKGYVHGGITPEESIVPLLHFAFDATQCKHPEITLGNDMLRFAVSTKLSIIVKNFNEFALEDICISIQNSNIKYNQVEGVSVDGYATTLIEIPGVRITKALDKKNNERMMLRVTYSANGRKYTFDSEVAMPMKSVQSSGSDLSDLF